jgi:hypothetical protein
VGQPLLKEPHTKAQRHEEKKDGTRERGRLVSKHNMLQIRSDYLLITPKPSSSLVPWCE